MDSNRVLGIYRSFLPEDYRFEVVKMLFSPHQFQPNVVNDAHDKTQNSKG